jgi:nuclear pore complex protein Nup107
MAPVTRSSLQGLTVSREDSWQIPTAEDLAPEQLADNADNIEVAGGTKTAEDKAMEDDPSSDSFDEDALHEEQGMGFRATRFRQDISDHLIEQDSRVTFPSANAEHILRPLQQTADRVSRQVEDFARRLDRFHSSGDTKRATLWKDALDLADAYRSITTSRKTQTSSDLLQARHPSRSRQSLQALAEEGRLELQRARTEADLWELFSVLTSFQDPAVQADYLKTQKSCLRGLHRYSSDSEVWETFLSADQFAEEYQEILRWLHKTARTSRSSIDDVAKSLRHKADRGEGIWSAGWLFTKESIKRQKRNRSWPKPLDHDNPGLESSHIRKPDSQKLVAQLDPDARFREAAALEEPDEYHEEAAWMAYWEMLRRGASVEKVREWWLERKEGWRAISTRGASLADLKDQEREWTRFTGLWKKNEWTASCYRVCRSNSVGTKYEAAVFGLLCGDVQVPLKVCQTMDDYLFVHLNAFLIERYRDFGHALSQKDARHTFQPGPPKYDEIRRLLQYCQHNEKTMQDSQNPFQPIQSMIISKDFCSFFLRQGRALAQIAKTSEQTSYLIFNDNVREANGSAEITASDPDCLRIIAHQQLILKALGYLDDLYAKHGETVENNLTAYIGWLQQEGKMALIPLYASTLSPERSARVLGAVIIDITDVKEREMMVNLMRRYGLDVSRVLLMQYQLNAAASALASDENPRTIRRVRVTEYSGPGKAKILKPKVDFIGGEIDKSEELLVRCLEWYRYGDKQCWSHACRAASALYKAFFSTGNLAAARALWVRAPLSTISRAALKIDLKHMTSSGNTTEEDDVELDGFVEEERAHPISPSKRRKFFKQQHAFVDEEPFVPGQKVLADQAQTWLQLEQLVEVLDALERWNEAAGEVEKYVGHCCNIHSARADHAPEPRAISPTCDR